MYLVDGNNVMGQRVGWHRDKAGARRRLLEEMARLAAAKKLRLTVVFDGAPAEHFPDGSSYRGVKIHYARSGSDADQRIIELVERERDRRGLVVVTSDQTLAARVRVCGVRVVRAGEFRRLLDETARTGNGAEQADTPAVPQEQMGEWLRYFGVAESDFGLDEDDCENPFA